MIDQSRFNGRLLSAKRRCCLHRAAKVQNQVAGEGGTDSDDGQEDGDSSEEEFSTFETESESEGEY